MTDLTPPPGHIAITHEDYDFTGAILDTGQTQPLMSRPPRRIATRKWVAQVERAVRDADGDMEALADWVLNAMEGYAALTARPVFETDGAGQNCSFCMGFWPLCGHHHMTSANVNNEETDA